MPSFLRRRSERHVLSQVLGAGASLAGRALGQGIVPPGAVVRGSTVYTDAPQPARLFYRARAAEPWTVAVDALSAVAFVAIAAACGVFALAAGLHATPALVVQEGVDRGAVAAFTVALETPSTFAAPFAAGLAGAAALCCHALLAKRLLLRPSEVADGARLPCTVSLVARLEPFLRRRNLYVLAHAGRTIPTPRRLDAAWTTPPRRRRLDAAATPPPRRRRDAAASSPRRRRRDAAAPRYGRDRRPQVR